MIRLNNLPEPVEIAPAKSPLNDVSQRKLKLKKATEAFESIFIAQLLKSMRSTSFTGKDEQQDGFGKDIMLAMADEGVAKQLSKSGMFGIGDILYKNLLKRLEGEELSAKLEITSQRHIDGVAPPRTVKEAPPAITNSKPLVPASSEIKIEPPKTMIVPLPVVRRIVERPGPATESIPPKPVQEAARAAAYDRLGRYVDDIEDAAKQSDLPVDLLRAMIMQESSGDHRAVSHRGAAGLMQLMPDTARSVGVSNPLDARENIMGGARYLRQMIDRFGNLESALAAYNAGPGNVERHGGVPPFPETQQYVKRILSELSDAKQVNKSSSDTDIDK